MRVTKIIVETPVTSFRYPHFLVGRQASFIMPPPSTIYGLIASVLGRWFDPDTTRFAYRFQFASLQRDLEHQHIIKREGKFFSYRGKKYPVSVQATIQPHQRDFLFGCTLTLYLDEPAMAQAFKSPVFCVTLGRSQDLASIASVEELVLEQAGGAYLEQTILPFSMRPLLGRGITVVMPRFIEPPPRREPYFDRFILLQDLVYAGNVEHSNRLLNYENQQPQKWWVDPSSPLKQGVHRGLVFHSFTP